MMVGAKYLVIALGLIGLALAVDGASHDWIAHQRADQAQTMVEKTRAEIMQAQQRMQAQQQAEQTQKAKFNECMSAVSEGKFKTLEECQTAEAAKPSKGPS